MLNFTKCKTLEETYVTRNNVLLGTIKTKLHRYSQARFDIVRVFQFHADLPDFNEFKRDSFPLRVSRKAAELDAEAYDEETRFRRNTSLPSTF